MAVKNERSKIINFSLNQGGKKSIAHNATSTSVYYAVRLEITSGTIQFKGCQPEYGDLYKTDGDKVYILTAPGGCEMELLAKTNNTTGNFETIEIFI